MNLIVAQVYYLQCLPLTTICKDVLKGVGVTSAPAVQNNVKVLFSIKRTRTIRLVFIILFSSGHLMIYLGEECGLQETIGPRKSSSISNRRFFHVHLEYDAKLIHACTVKLT